MASALPATTKLNATTKANFFMSGIPPSFDEKPGDEHLPHVLDTGDDGVP
jgi:hypothetical protein